MRNLARTLGISMLLTPFGLTLYVYAESEGFWITMKVFGGFILLLTWIIVGSLLLTGKSIFKE